MRRMYQSGLSVVSALVFCAASVLMPSNNPALAQVATAITSSGLNTQISTPTTLPNGQVGVNITGGTRPGNGTNLFHSFGEFSVGANQVANFLNESALPTSNILGRVTGGNVSNIFGTIQTTGFGNANLFLMNPAGFLFGPGATVNVGGMMAFTTADYLRLADGARFKAVPGAMVDTLLSASPVAAFGFLGSNPGAITVQGGIFSVTRGTGLSLVGGDITTGSLSAPAGQISLVSVASRGEVVRTTTPQGGESFDVSSFSRLGDVAMNDGGIVADLTLIRGGQLVIDNVTTGPATNLLHIPQFTRGLDIEVRGDALVQGSTINTINGATIMTAKNLTLQSTRIIGAASVVDIVNPQGTSVSLNASNNLTIDSASSVFLYYAHNRPANSNISLRGGRIVMDGSLSTGGEGSFQTPGSVSLDATKSIDITGSIRTVVDQFAFSASGNVTINAPTVRVTGGTINASAGPLGAGDITITGTNVSLTQGTTIDVHGASIGGASRAGRITIRGGKVLVDNASLDASNRVESSPGGITIEGNQSVIIRNGSSLIANNNNVSPGPAGTLRAGTIHLESGNKVLVQDSTVSANAGGAHAGTIEIESPGVVRIENSVISASTTGTNATARGGMIEISSPEKVVIEGSELRTNAVAGPGGSINITATHRVVEDVASVISATSSTGPDGSVTVIAPVAILNGVVEP